MEVWTLINLESNKPIRFYITRTSGEFDIKYYLSEHDLFPIWFVDSYDEIKYVFESRYIHPSESMFYNKPSIDYIKMSDYKIAKFISDDK